MACSPRAVREAENVVAQADSLWRAGQMYGREAKKYVLYGDPSLYLFGLDIQYNQPYNIQKRLQQGDEEFVGDIISVNIYSMTGQLLRACNGDKPNTQGLPAGTYMVVYNSSNNSITKKFVLQ
jgi:hypothetical protein